MGLDLDVEGDRKWAHAQGRTGWFGSSWDCKERQWWTNRLNLSHEKLSKDIGADYYICAV